MRWRRGFTDGFRLPKGGRWAFEYPNFRSGVAELRMSVHWPIIRDVAMGVVFLILGQFLPHHAGGIMLPLFGLAQQTVRRGNSPNDHANADSWYDGTGKINENFSDLYSLQSQTINAGARIFQSGATAEDRIQLAINQAVIELAERVFVPASMCPYDASLVTFDNDIWMVREGGSWDEFDVGAYGATGDGVADDTDEILAAINATGEGGSIKLTGMHATTGIAVTTADATRFTILGTRGGEAKQSGGIVTGFCPIGDQDYVLKIGPDTGSEVAGVILHGVVFDGKSKIIEKGMLWAANMSQAKIDRCSFRKANGPGLYCNKLEDCQITNCQLMYLGYTSNKGGVVFGAKPTDSTFGNNVIQFSHCRFEFIDGGHVRTEPGATEAWAVNVRFDQCKFEAGTDQGWGATASSYGIFSLEDPTFAFYVVNLSIQDCWFEGVQKADCILRLGAFHTVQFQHNTLSCSDAAIVLFRLKTAGGGSTRSDSFIFTDNTVRNYSLTYASFAMSYENLLTSPILFEWPIERSSPSTMLSKHRPERLLMASEAGEPATLVTDPDPSTDPCISFGGTVAAVTGAGGGVLMSLGASNYISKPSGLSRFMPTNVRVWIHCKKAGTGTTANLRAISGATTLVSAIAVANTTWAWVETVLDLTLLSATAAITINANTGNDAGHTVYVDAVKIDFIGASYPNDLNLRPGVITQNVGTMIVVNAGTNSGANDKNAAVAFSMGNSNHWTVGIRGSSATDKALRIRDVLSGGVGMVMALTTLETTMGGDVTAAGGYRQTVDGWIQDNVAANQTNVELTRAVGRWTAPRAGSVTAIVVHATEARTAGTVTVDVFKNTGLAGAAGSSIGLTAVLDGTNTSRKATTQAKDTDAFAVGDELYIVVTTPAGWTPTTSDIRCALEVET